MRAVGAAGTLPAELVVQLLVLKAEAARALPEPKQQVEQSPGPAFLNTVLFLFNFST